MMEEVGVLEMNILLSAHLRLHISRFRGGVIAGDSRSVI